MEVTADVLRSMDGAVELISDDDLRWATVDTLLAARSIVGDGKPYSIVVLAARRMVCLNALLSRCGFEFGPGTTVLSDRFLEFTDVPGGWANKNVLILDDVVNSGATLELIIERARNLVGPSGVIGTGAIAASIPPRKIPELDRNLPLPIRRDRNKLSFFAQDLAKVFGDALLPLLVDFPVSEELVLPAGEFERLLGLGGWPSFDVSNALSFDQGVRSYSLLPDDDSMAEILDWFGNPDIIELCKIRLLARSLHDGFAVRVVPIVTLKPLVISSLQTAFGNLGFERLSRSDSGSSLGVLSYVLSVGLMKYFSSVVSSATDRNLSMDLQLGSMYLGTSLLERLSNDHRVEAYSILSSLVTGSVPDNSVPGGDLSGFSSLKSSGSHCLIGDDLVEPVLASIRANSGIAVTELGTSHSTSGSTVGLALDVLNDTGIAVPENRRVGDVLVRVYEKGELLPETLAACSLGGVFGAVSVTMIRELNDRFASDIRPFHG